MQEAFMMAISDITHSGLVVESMAMRSLGLIPMLSIPLAILATLMANSCQCKMDHFWARRQKYWMAGRLPSRLTVLSNSVGTDSLIYPPCCFDEDWTSVS